MRNIQPESLKSHLDESKAGCSLILLDVREPHEHAICCIAGSIKIPLSEIQSRINELDPDLDIVVICHHGMRSLQAAMFLESTGFKNVMNLIGGIHAWAKSVDPSMETY